MPYLAGTNTLERLNEAAAIAFRATFVLASSVAPTYTLQPANLVNNNDIAFTFNTGNGTLFGANITFAGTNTAANWTGGSILNPTFGLEIADAYVQASGSVLFCLGMVESATNATTNVGAGTPFYSDRATNDGYVSAGQGIATNVRCGLFTATAVTNLLVSMNGATGSTIKACFRVGWLQR